MKYTMGISQKEADLLRLALVHYEEAGEVQTRSKVTAGEAKIAQKLIDKIRDILDLYEEEEFDKEFEKDKK